MLDELEFEMPWFFLWNVMFVFIWQNWECWNDGPKKWDYLSKELMKMYFYRKIVIEIDYESKFEIHFVIYINFIPISDKNVGENNDF